MFSLDKKTTVFILAGTVVFFRVGGGLVGTPDVFRHYEYSYILSLFLFYIATPIY